AFYHLQGFVARAEAAGVARAVRAGNSNVTSAKFTQAVDPKKFIDRLVEPEHKIYLIKDRVQLVILKVTPTRAQIGNEDIAVYNLVSPKEITLRGRGVGTTDLNLWFTDESGKQSILSYIVRVLPADEDATLEKSQAAMKGAAPQTARTRTPARDRYDA